MVDVLYTARATAAGGRTGEVFTDDGALDLELSMPPELGGQGGEGTNPEQLLAAGWSACFSASLARVAAQRGTDVEGASVTADVSLGSRSKQLELQAVLTGVFPALDRATAETMMRAAHKVCPFSRAMLGNVEVVLQVEGPMTVERLSP